jgi:two-component system LytT family response regulator
MFSAVIIDDEARVRETIQHMLSAYCPDINVIGQANSVASGYDLIENFKPEVVFLDIKMQDGTGFDLLKKFKNFNFHFIIITAHEEFAIQAFKFSALDYILKPIDSADLQSAVSKLTKIINIEETNIKFDTLLSNFDNSKKDLKKLVLKTHDNVFVVDVKDIVRCESQNNYTQFHLVDKTSILVSRTLKEYEEMLSSLSFIRCHQTHLVNALHVVKFVKYPNPTLLMSDGHLIPVSVRKKMAIENLLKK